MVLDPTTIDWMIKEAERSLVEGTLYEPRAYFDVVSIPSTTAQIALGTITPGQPAAFVNTEQFPVRITRMTLSLLYTTEAQGPPILTLDERLMDQIGLRLRVHDSYYESRVPARLPLWQNETPTIPDVVAPGVSVWHFDRPVILSSRDTLQLIAQITDSAAPARTVSVAFHGVGYITRRPYYIEGSKAFTTSPQRQDLDTQPFDNDGSEPVVLHTMVTRVSAATLSLDPTGDTRVAGIFASQLGNGTNAPWVHAPPTAFASPYNGIQLCPASLLGPDGGRAIVHRFPGAGFVWEPGEGVEVDAIDLGTAQSPGPIALGVGMLGYIAVR